MIRVRRSFGGLVVVASVLLAAAASGSSPIQVPAATSKTFQFASTKDAFETDGLLDQREVVLVQPMVESDVRVSLRARAAGVEPSSIKAKAYGLKIFVLRKDPEIGTAFMHRTQVYHLGSGTDQLIVDEIYWYCNGFLSADIAKVEEKSWSKYYASNAGDIARLDTLAEAIRNGTGHQEAYRALSEPLGGGLLRNGGAEQNRFEREVTWFAGRQAIEGVGIELTRSREVGNRVTIRFVQ